MEKSATALANHLANGNALPAKRKTFYAVVTEKNALMFIPERLPHEPTDEKTIVEKSNKIVQGLSDAGIAVAEQERSFHGNLTARFVIDIGKEGGARALNKKIETALEKSGGKFQSFVVVHENTTERGL